MWYILIYSVVLVALVLRQTKFGMMSSIYFVNGIVFVSKSLKSIGQIA